MSLPRIGIASDDVGIIFEIISRKKITDKRIVVSEKLVKKDIIFYYQIISL